MDTDKREVGAAAVVPGTRLELLLFDPDAYLSPSHTYIPALLLLLIPHSRPVQNRTEPSQSC